MLGLFRKKKSVPEPDPVAAVTAEIEQSLNVANFVAAAINVPLTVCRTHTNFFATLHEEYTRGYIVGVCDAMAQHAGLNLDDHLFIAYIVAAHVRTLQNDVENPAKFAMQSLALQGTELFDNGQKSGGQHLMASFKDKESLLKGFLRLFFEHKPSP